MERSWTCQSAPRFAGWLTEFQSSSNRRWTKVHRYRFCMPLSTFLYPDGTANLDGSTDDDENPLISVVISMSASEEPPEGAAVEADSCFSSFGASFGGASAFFLRPKPPKPPNLPPSTP